MRRRINAVSSSPERYRLSQLLLDPKRAFCAALAQVNEPSKDKGERVNVVAVPGELPERPLFKAVEDIPVDAELLVNYGSRYDRSRQTTKRREREPSQR